MQTNPNEQGKFTNNGLLFNYFLLPVIEKHFFAVNSIFILTSKITSDYGGLYKLGKGKYIIAIEEWKSS